MSMIDLCSFDHYTTADFGKKTWTLLNASTRATIETGVGRNATNCLRMTYLAATNSIKCAIRGHDALGTVFYGIAFYTDGAWADYASDEACHIYLFQGTNATLALAIPQTGAIYAFRVDGGTLTYLGSTSGGLITINTWHYIELKAVISNTAGAVTVRVNGVEELALTNVDTRGSSMVGDFVDGIGFGVPDDIVSGSYCQYDDLYINNTTGAAPWNGFLGDIHVKALLPETPNGNYTAWTPSTGTDHWALVDETTPNTTDYVESSTLGQKDSFNFPALNIDNATIMGVQLNFAAQKDDSGNSLIKPLARISATDYTYSPGVAVTTGQSYSRYIWQVSPATATNWTEAEIDAAEFGMELG